MKLAVIVPFYNEADCARDFIDALSGVLCSIPTVRVQLILVNDGSTDRTPLILDELAAGNTDVLVVHLWGNHGHQRALVAGLDHTDADLVLTMDGDGQHPVETAQRIVEEAIRNPHALVIQALRNGKQCGRVKNLTSAWFYRASRWMLPEIKLRTGASDFRLIRQSVLRLIKQYPDRYRNIRMLLASLNLSTVYVPYEVGRRIAGRTRYRLKHMLALATDGWFAFSSSPLRISILLMCGSAVIGFFYLAYVLIMFILGNTIPGWTSIIAFTAFMFSAVFGILAIMSEYVARIYEDVRRHPVYRLRPDPKGDASLVVVDTQE